MGPAKHQAGQGGATAAWWQQLACSPQPLTRTLCPVFWASCPGQALLQPQGDLVTLAQGHSEWTSDGTVGLSTLDLNGQWGVLQGGEARVWGEDISEGKGGQAALVWSQRGSAMTRVPLG